jgi:hypothetical protein
MNYTQAQNRYLPTAYQPPWFPQQPYYTPVPSNVFVQQPRQQNHEGLLSLLVVLGFLFTWIDSRRQKAEIRQLQQHVQYLGAQISRQGITMNQTHAIDGQPESSSIGISPPPTSFGDGTHFVGVDGVQPGIYRVSEPGLRYYVARLRNCTGQMPFWPTGMALLPESSRSFPLTLVSNHGAA